MGEQNELSDNTFEVTALCWFLLQFVFTSLADLYADVMTIWEIFIFFNLLQERDGIIGSKFRIILRPLFYHHIISSSYMTVFTWKTSYLKFMGFVSPSLAIWNIEFNVTDCLHFSFKAMLLPTGYLWYECSPFLCIYIHIHTPCTKVVFVLSAASYYLDGILLSALFCHLSCILNFI